MAKMAVDAPEGLAENLPLEPLMALPVSVPAGWKDIVYGPDGSGSIGESEEIWLNETEESHG